MSPAEDKSREVPLLMPKMSMTMEEGEVITWHAAEGDQVSAGEVIAEVMTDKVDMEVEAPVDGILVRIVADPRSMIAVGAPMAFIRTESDDLMAGLFDDSDSSVADIDAAPPADPAPPNGGPAPKATPASRRGPQPAVPFARRRAAELRVALSAIEGSGPDGLVTVEDVERFAKDSTGHPAADQPKPSGGIDPGYADELTARRRSIRATVARTMTRSALVPQFTVFAELNLDPLDRARGRIGWTTLLLRALARALRNEPRAASGWNEASGAAGPAPEQIAVALAVDSAVGLLAPVVRDPDQATVADLDATIRTLVERTRTGRLSKADLDGATTTLSNLGGFGVPSFTALLTPPQSSALSVGVIGLRPVVIGSGLALRLGTTIGLTVDHRTVDGADAARVLNEISALVRDPDRLLA